MRSFIHDHFLLQSKTAQSLYHEYAAAEPIFDYHCHLSPKDIAENRKFNDLYEIWLEGDHYKWRAMRLDGTDERFCTGDATPYEKFQAFAKTVPNTLRNPLYHWTHLELARYFSIDELLDERSAPAIWENANTQLQTDDLSSWGILKKMNVDFVGTTDDPVDSLEYHKKIENSDCPATVAPTFRPDKALLLKNTEAWNQWISQLEGVINEDIKCLGDLKSALLARINFFDTMGCRASDHGLNRCPLKIGSDEEAEAAFMKARSGTQPDPDACEAFAGNLLAFLGESYAEFDWVMQLHLGAIRNNNAYLFNTLGADIGCDSISDEQQIPALAGLLSELSSRQRLPNTILYNLNPAENYAFATMCGNFFQKGTKHKIQFGSGWWFLDQWEGMTWQINALSSLGLLAHFVGMLTDSRSMMSYPRHEYFRRLLCQLLADDMEKGVIPNDIDRIGRMVKNIAFTNAKTYFK